MWQLIYFDIKLYDFLDENGNDIRSGIILTKENETEQIENAPHFTDKAIGLKESISQD